MGEDVVGGGGSNAVFQVRTSSLQGTREKQECRLRLLSCYNVEIVNVRWTRRMSLIQKRERGYRTVVVTRSEDEKRKKCEVVRRK